MRRAVLLVPLVAMPSLFTPTFAQQPLTPKIIEQVDPAYPEGVRALGIQGTTTLRVFVLAGDHDAEVGARPLRRA
jgi:hypothetical protein